MLVTLLYDFNNKLYVIILIKKYDLIYISYYSNNQLQQITIKLLKLFIFYYNYL